MKMVTTINIGLAGSHDTLVRGSSRVLSIHNRLKQKKLLGEKRTRKTKRSDKKEKKTHSNWKSTRKKAKDDRRKETTKNEEQNTVR